MVTRGRSSPRRSAAARSVPMPPTATNGGRRSSSRRAQASAISSGPTPAGSPSDTARGRIMASVVFDHRVAAQVAQITLRALLDPLILDRAGDLIAVGAAGLARRIVAPAQHEHAHAFLDRAVQRRRLAE